MGEVKRNVYSYVSTLCRVVFVKKFLDYEHGKRNGIYYRQCVFVYVNKHHVFYFFAFPFASFYHFPFLCVIYFIIRKDLWIVLLLSPSFDWNDFYYDKLKRCFMYKVLKCERVLTPHLMKIVHFTLGFTFSFPRSLILR